MLLDFTRDTLPGSVLPLMMFGVLLADRKFLRMISSRSWNVTFLGAVGTTVLFKWDWQVGVNRITAITRFSASCWARIVFARKKSTSLFEAAEKVRECAHSHFFRPAIFWMAGQIGLTELIVFRYAVLKWHLWQTAPCFVLEWAHSSHWPTGASLLWAG